MFQGDPVDLGLGPGNGIFIAPSPPTGMVNTVATEDAPLPKNQEGWDSQ